MNYYIQIDRRAIPVSEEIYKAYCKGIRKERYFAESDIHNHIFSYDSLDCEKEFVEAGRQPHRRLGSRPGGLIPPDPESQKARSDPRLLSSLGLVRNRPVLIRHLAHHVEDQPLLARRQLRRQT